MRDSLYQPEVKWELSTFFVPIRAKGENSSDIPRSQISRLNNNIIKQNIIHHSNMAVHTKYWKPHPNHSINLGKESYDNNNIGQI
jgi:hypothetical protein